MNSRTLVGLIVVVIAVLAVLAVVNNGTLNGTGPLNFGPTPTGTQAPQGASPLQQSGENNPTPTEQTLENEVFLDVTSQGFIPKELTVNTGTKVTFRNVSGQTIAVASDPHPQHTSYPPLNLGQVVNGNTVSLVFDKSGTYNYHNHLNPSQKGTIVVQ